MMRVELAHQADLAAPALDDFGNHLFGAAFAIHLRGVDQTQSEIQTQAQGSGFVRAARPVLSHSPGALAQPEVGQPHCLIVGDILAWVTALVEIETGDRKLLESVTGIMAEAARRGGAWVACRPGCTQCCIGPFGITQLDALRIRQGLLELEAADAPRAAAVRARAAKYVTEITPDYPGDPESGELWEEDSLPDSMGDTACPALDPETGLCDLYSARPITCRTFGPVTRLGEETFGACELCYVGATDEEMARCAVDVDSEGLESRLLGALESAGARGMTTVAFALTRPG
jgi:Fe-S-cluster containining protein